MPTLQDVAKKAGVAPMTVSRVINHSGYASPDVRERVLEAVKELGYVPNTLARSLRIRRTNSIALIITDITNPFFTTIARGVEDTANAAGFSVIFGNTDESEEKETRYLDMILQKRVDGLLLVPAGGSKTSIEHVQRNQTPLVVLDRGVSGNDVDVVRCDSVDGAYRLTRLLLGLGHRQIALLTGTMGVSTAEDRAEGFRRAMREAEIADPQICFGNYTQESGYTLARRALSIPYRPTAIIAGNNFMAIGALKAIRDAGLEVPEDVALAGFDDFPPAMVAEPFLTGMVQPAYVMGRIAAELLINRITGIETGAPQEILLPMELVIRQSSGSALG